MAIFTNIESTEYSTVMGDEHLMLDGFEGDEEYDDDEDSCNTTYNYSGGDEEYDDCEEDDE